MQHGINNLIPISRGSIRHYIIVITKLISRAAIGDAALYLVGFYGEDSSVIFSSRINIKSIGN